MLDMLKILFNTAQWQAAQAGQQLFAAVVAHPFITFQVAAAISAIAMLRDDQTT